MQIFLAGFQAIENAIEEKCVVAEFAEEQPKIATVEFDPVFFTLQMFQPPRPQITRPMFPNPAADGVFTLIAPRLFTFDPFVFIGFLFAVLVYAHPFHGGACDATDTPLREVQTSDSLLDGHVQSLPPMEADAE